MAESSPTIMYLYVFDQFCGSSGSFVPWKSTILGSSGGNSDLLVLSSGSSPSGDPIACCSSPLGWLFSLWNEVSISEISWVHDFMKTNGRDPCSYKSVIEKYATCSHFNDLPSSDHIICISALPNHMWNAVGIHSSGSHVAQLDALFV
jgi:hypothetical protein